MSRSQRRVRTRLAFVISAPGSGAEVLIDLLVSDHGFTHIDLAAMLKTFRESDSDKFPWKRKKRTNADIDRDDVSIAIAFLRSEIQKNISRGRRDILVTNAMTSTLFYEYLKACLGDLGVSRPLVLYFQLDAQERLTRLTASHAKRSVRVDASSSSTSPLPRAVQAAIQLFEQHTEPLVSSLLHTRADALPVSFRVLDMKLNTEDVYRELMQALRLEASVETMGLLDERLEMQRKRAMLEALEGPAERKQLPSKPNSSGQQRARGSIRGNLSSNESVVIFAVGPNFSGRATQVRKISQAFRVHVIRVADLVEEEKSNMETAPMLAKLLEKNHDLPAELYVSLLQQKITELCQKHQEARNLPSSSSSSSSGGGSRGDMQGVPHFLVEGFPRNERDWAVWTTYMGTPSQRHRVRVPFVMYFKCSTQRAIQRAQEERANNVIIVKSKLEAQIRKQYSRIQPLLQRLTQDALLRVINSEVDDDSTHAQVSSCFASLEYLRGFHFEKLDYSVIAQNLVRIFSVMDQHISFYQNSEHQQDASRTGPVSSGRNDRVSQLVSHASGGSEYYSHLVFLFIMGAARATNLYVATMLQRAYDLRVVDCYAVLKALGEVDTGTETGMQQYMRALETRVKQCLRSGDVIIALVNFPTSSRDMAAFEQSFCDIGKALGAIWIDLDESAGSSGGALVSPHVSQKQVAQRQARQELKDVVEAWKSQHDVVVARDRKKTLHGESGDFSHDSTFPFVRVSCGVATSDNAVYERIFSHPAFPALQLELISRRSISGALSMMRCSLPVTILLLGPPGSCASEVVRILQDLYGFTYIDWRTEAEKCMQGNADALGMALSYVREQKNVEVPPKLALELVLERVNKEIARRINSSENATVSNPQTSTAFNVQNNGSRRGSRVHRESVFFDMEQKYQKGRRTVIISEFGGSAEEWFAQVVSKDVLEIAFVVEVKSTQRQMENRLFALGNTENVAILGSQRRVAATSNSIKYGCQEYVKRTEAIVEYYRARGRHRLFLDPLPEEKQSKRTEEALMAAAMKKSFMATLQCVHKSFDIRKQLEFVRWNPLVLVADEHLSATKHTAEFGHMLSGLMDAYGLVLVDVGKKIAASREQLKYDDDPIVNGMIAIRSEVLVPLTTSSVTGILMVNVPALFSIGEDSVRNAWMAWMCHVEPWCDVRAICSVGHALEKHIDRVLTLEYPSFRGLVRMVSPEAVHGRSTLQMMALEELRGVLPTHIESRNFAPGLDGPVELSLCDVRVTFFLAPFGAGITSVCNRLAEESYVKFIDVRETSFVRMWMDAFSPHMREQLFYVPYQIGLYALRQEIAAGARDGYTHFVVDGYMDCAEALTAWERVMHRYSLLPREQITFVFLAATYDERCRRLYERKQEHDTWDRVNLRSDRYRQETVALVTLLRDSGRLIEVNSNGPLKQTMENLRSAVLAVAGEESLTQCAALVELLHLSRKELHVTFTTASSAGSSKQESKSEVVVLDVDDLLRMEQEKGDSTRLLLLGALESEELEEKDLGETETSKLLVTSGESARSSRSSRSSLYPGLGSLTEHRSENSTRSALPRRTSPPRRNSDSSRHSESRSNLQSRLSIKQNMNFLQSAENHFTVLARTRQRYASHGQGVGVSDPGKLPPLLVAFVVKREIMRLRFVRHVHQFVVTRLPRSSAIVEHLATMLVQSQGAHAPTLRFELDAETLKRTQALGFAAPFKEQVTITRI